MVRRRKIQRNLETKKENTKVGIQSIEKEYSESKQ